MARQAGEKFDAREFEKYMRNFDRTAFGMGSDRDPPTDRFSGKDIRIMFDEGRKMGGSKAEIAQDVLDYAADYKDVTKMGGTAEWLPGKKKSLKLCVKIATFYYCVWWLWSFTVVCDPQKGEPEGR